MKTALYLILFAVAGIFAGLAGQFWVHTHEPSPNTSPVAVDIPRGAGPERIGKILTSTGVLATPRYFVWYCRLTGSVSGLRAGAYTIPAGVDMPGLVRILSTGTPADRRVTIPEGRASWEIYGILHQHYPDLDSLTWEALVHDSSFVRELGVPSPSLEGWLFPDTYSLPLNADERALASILVHRALHVTQGLDSVGIDIRERLGGWHGVLTLASIVEEETGNPSERPHIAGVFLNRLRIGMPLGADPTVRFVYRDLTGELRKSQLESSNPYNTRRQAGLPPGPISNPGQAAIRAVLDPDATSDLYFVAKDDGSGLHFFAKSLMEHNRWKSIAARNRKAQGL